MEIKEESKKKADYTAEVTLEQKHRKTEGSQLGKELQHIHKAIATPSVRNS